MTRYERKIAAVRARNEAADEDYHRRLQQRIDQDRARYDSDIAARKEAAEQHNAVLEENSARFKAGDPEAIDWYLSQVLTRSQYPARYPGQDRQYTVRCRPDHQDIFIEVELPPASVVPLVQSYQHVPGQAESLPLPRPRSEVSEQYRRLIAAIALRTMDEALAATTAHTGTLRGVTLVGRAQGIDAATGRTSHPCLLSVSASREELSALELSQVRPDTCLDHLGARFSSDPLGMQPAE